MQSCRRLSTRSASSAHIRLRQLGRTLLRPHKLWQSQGWGLEAADCLLESRVQQPCRCIGSPSWQPGYCWSQERPLQGPMLAQARQYDPSARTRASGAADSSGMMPIAEAELLQQQQQQQLYQQHQQSQPVQQLPQQQLSGMQQPQQQQMPPNVPEASSRPGSPGRQYASAVMPSLEQLKQPRVPALLAWLPAPLLLHIRSLLGFLRACWELRPEFVSPSLPEALRRLVLVLGASLVMIVVVSTIDSGWLYVYLVNVRKVAVAA